MFCLVCGAVDRSSAGGYKQPYRIRYCSPPCMDFTEHFRLQIASTAEHPAVCVSLCLAGCVCATASTTGVGGIRRQRRHSCGRVFCIACGHFQPIHLSLLLQGSFVVTGLLACWTKLRPWTSTGACNRAYCPRKTYYHAHAGLGAVKRGCGVRWPQRYTLDLHRCPPHLNDGGLCVKLPTRLKLLLLVL